MAIKSKDELLEALRTRIGEDNSDEAIALIEDFVDTYDDLENKSKGDGTDWKQKYEDNDKEWREKYISRFSSGSDNNDELNNEQNNEQKKETKEYKYENLFEESEC